MTLRTWTSAGIGAVVLSGATFLAACGGGGSGNPQVASLGGASGATSTTATPTQADSQQAMLDFATCMREHGIDMPDPQFSADGRISVGMAADPGQIDEQKMEAAQQACQSYMDKVQASAPPMDPAKEEEMKQQALAFAQCMRDHGIDMPDPQINTDGKGGVMVRQGGAGVDPDSPGFKEASETCQKQVGMNDMVGGARVATGGGGGSDGGVSNGATP